MDWTRWELVIFDVDGTLYDQRKMRSLMLVQLLRYCVSARSLKVPYTLSVFRQCREKLGNSGEANFVTRQYELTAQQLGISPHQVREIANEWIEQRPLSVINRCKYSGVDAVFTALRKSGRRIAVFSDYPAAQKIKAMGLASDLVVSATDGDVLRLKPDPTGLRKILFDSGKKVESSLMIGDRFDRDWAAARQIGMKALIKSRKSHSECTTFSTYQDRLFLPLLQALP